MVDIDRDPWVDGKMQPYRTRTKPVGMRFRDKLNVVRWLQRQYGISHDQAMRDADSMERYVEQNT